MNLAGQIVSIMQHVLTFDSPSSISVELLFAHVALDASLREKRDKDMVEPPSVCKGERCGGNSRRGTKVFDNFEEIMNQFTGIWLILAPLSYTRLTEFVSSGRAAMPSQSAFVQLLQRSSHCHFIRKEDCSRSLFGVRFCSAMLCHKTPLTVRNRCKWDELPEPQGVRLLMRIDSLFNTTRPCSKRNKEREGKDRLV